MSDKKVRVYCDGIYDLFHLGHMKSLQQAKEMFPNVHLIVGCCGDEITHEKKGLTVLTAKERCESLKHCRWVDEVVENSPWLITQEFIDEHKIDYVAHDDIPYKDGNTNDVYEFVKSQGKFLATKRTPAISTTDIIDRILNNADKFRARNMKK